MEELKPCPFCGGEAEEDAPIEESPYWQISCSKCHASMLSVDQSMNRKKWNKRYKQTQVCENCGREYEPTSEGQKYCCKSCKEMAHIKRSDPETAAILARIYGGAEVK